MSKRIKWIDTAKGLGIILVILGHKLTISSSIYNYIYSFHMPFFFFLSGYLFSDINNMKLKDFAIKKSRSLLIPYFIFAAISYIYWIFFQTQMGDDIKHPDMGHLFVGIFYSNPNYHFMAFNVALWFLTCLFCTEILFFNLIKKIKNIHYIVLALILFSIAGYIYSLHSLIKLPWSFDVALSAVVFYGAGYLCKVYKPDNLLINNRNKIFILLTLIPVSFIISQINSGVEMSLNIINNYVLFYIAAFTGIFCWLIISFWLKNSKILSYIGKNSLIIFALHLKLPTDYFIEHAIKINPETINGNLYGIVYLFVILVFFIPAILVMNNFFHRKKPETA
jgi:fucose 4-O-acetylase-like acetyltransferase